MIDSTLADAYIHILSFGCYDRCVAKKGTKTLSIMNLCVNFLFFFGEKINLCKLRKQKKKKKKEEETKPMKIT